MPESADAEDAEYLLRGLAHTVVRLRAAAIIPVRPAPGSADEAILAFVRANPGCTVTQLHEQVPSLSSQSYDAVRAAVIGLLADHSLEKAGQASLEQVDPVYERIPACDLCGDPSTAHPILFWKHNTPVVRCTGCGLLYANPRWKAEHLFGHYTPEFWAGYADKVKDTALDPATNQARWDPYLNVLEAVRQTGRLLDVGCATGEFLAAAKARGWAGYGVETSPVSAAYAEHTYGVQAHVGSLDTAPWPDGYFDAVTLFDVIEHVQSPRDYLTRIARLIRSGGMFALTTPNIRSLSYAVLGRAWYVVGPNDHIYYFAPRTLARLLAETGFAIHYLGTHNAELATWQRLLRLPQLQRFAPRLLTLAQPLVLRFLIGDELVVFARRLGF